MTEQKRNIAVGITVLAALCGLGYMLLLFGELPAFARPGYLVRVRFPESGGMSAGGDVRLNGVRIGTIADMKLLSDPRSGVDVECRIDHEVRIPRDVHVTIGSHGLGAGMHVKLTTSPLRPGQPHADWLATDDSAVLVGFLSTGGLIGPEITAKLDKIAQGFGSFSRLADNLNRLVAPAPAPTSAPAAGLVGTVERLNRVLDSFYAITGDAENRANIKASLDNLHNATAEGVKAMQELREFAAGARESLKKIDESAVTVKDVAKATGKRVDALAGKLMEDADQLGRLLAHLNQAAGKLAQGEGSAGKFLDDPQLYNNLLESTSQLASTLRELQTTVKIWRQEGVKVKLR